MRKYSFCGAVRFNILTRLDKKIPRGRQTNERRRADLLNAPLTINKIGTHVYLEVATQESLHGTSGVINRPEEQRQRQMGRDHHIGHTSNGYKQSWACFQVEDKS
jgi:hypothetical protein